MRRPLLIGLAFMIGGCASAVDPELQHSPLTARSLRLLMPPPLARFEAVVTADSMRLRMPVLGADVLRWDVVPYRERPGVEYMFEAQWDTVRGPMMDVGRYVEAVAVTLDEPPRAPRQGTLSELIQAMTVQAIGLSKADGRVRSGWVADRSVRVTAEDSSVVIWLAPSPRLARVRRVHPDSIQFAVFLSPQGIAYRRTVPLRYR